jgi:hypothetical protein
MGQLVATLTDRSWCWAGLVPVPWGPTALLNVFHGPVRPLVELHLRRGCWFGSAANQSDWAGLQVFFLGWAVLF